MTSDLGREIDIWIERLLLDASEKEKEEAAATLGRLSARQRGTVRTRGSATLASPPRAPQLDDTAVIQALIEHARSPLRCQIALALGELGGENASRVLAQLLHADPDETVRFYCIGALRTIGGPVAVKALCEAAETFPSNLRSAAIGALGELALGSLQDVTDSATRVSSTSQEVRVRGASSSHAVVETLRRVRADASIPMHLRIGAEEILSQIGRE